MLQRLLLFVAIGLMMFLSWRSYSSTPVGRVRELRNPALPGSLAPSLTATSDGKVVLSWLEPAEPGLALRFSIWDGKTWSSPETVVRGSDFDVYAEAPPSVQKLGNGTLLSLWGQKIKTGGKWDGSYLFSTVSADGGKHWSAPMRVHSDASLSEHSFSSIAPIRPDRALVVWLDARDDATKHRYRLMSAVIDSKGTVSDERTVDEDTCTCCPTALVTTPAALAIAAYRGHNSEEIRDIKLSRLSAGAWETPRAVHDDNWHINGCPVNGPALSVNGDSLSVIWFTGKDEKPEVKMAFSRDLANTFRQPQVLDTPTKDRRPVGHVATTVLDDRSVLAIWLRQNSSDTEIVAQHLSENGAEGPALVVAEGTVRGLGYPRLQRLGESAIVSWSGKDGKEVKTAMITP